jgi:predicted signal transduction protein with EAL and GGDEF domain
LSIGIAELSARSETLEELIERADKALYRSKAHGRETGSVSLHRKNLHSELRPTIGNLEKYHRGHRLLSGAQPSQAPNNNTITRKKERGF